MHETSKLSAKERHERHQLEALRTIAIVEFAKGALALLLGFGVISLVRHGDIWDYAEDLLEFFHINPEARYSQVFLALADRVDDTKVWMLAAFTATYSTLRFIESFGLWRARAWAEWLALASGAIYLPLEIYEMVRKPSVTHLAILLVNLAIVLYMAYLRFVEKPSPLVQRK